MPPPADPGGRRRDGRLLGVLVVGAAAANVARSTVVPDGIHFWFNLAIGGLAMGVAVAAGLRAPELGLGRSELGRGLRLGGLVFGVVALGVGVAVAVPRLRPLLEDDRADVGLGALLLAVLVVIPLGTVVAEELLFRGTLLGLLERRMTPTRALVVSAGLFGLWHVVPTWRGDGPALAAGTLLATTVAGLGFGWLRQRSGSLVAPVLAHVATNSVTYLGAWLVTR